MQALQNGEITERQKMYYYLFISLSTVAVLSLASYSEPMIDNTYVRGFEAIGYILLTLFGTFAIFKVNEQGDNKDFLSRLFVLSLPISVRMFVYGTVLYLLLIIVSATAFGYTGFLIHGEDKEAFIEFVSNDRADTIREVTDVAFFLGLGLVAIFWVCSAMKRVATGASSQ